MIRDQHIAYPFASRVPNIFSSMLVKLVDSFQVFEMVDGSWSLGVCLFKLEAIAEHLYPSSFGFFVFFFHFI